MTNYLLDTNIISEMTRSRPEPRVKAWIDSQDIETLFLSVVSVGELRKGIAVMPPGIRQQQLAQWLDFILYTSFAGRILPLSLEIAERWGVMDAERQVRGHPLSPADGQIAATALISNLTLVTRNVKDFLALGLDILNPWDLPA